MEHAIQMGMTIPVSHPSHHSTLGHEIDRGTRGHTDDGGDDDLFGLVGRLGLGHSVVAPGQPKRERERSERWGRGRGKRALGSRLWKRERGNRALGSKIGDTRRTGGGRGEGASGRLGPREEGGREEATEGSNILDFDMFAMGQITVDIRRAGHRLWEKRLSR